MLIPHSNIKPIRLNFSVAFLVTLAVGWTGLTLWSGFIASRHVDYWRAKTDEQILRGKVWYFSQERCASRASTWTASAKTEIALQNLLNMKTRKAIVENDHNGVGGPLPMDRRDVMNVLAQYHASVNLEDFNRQLNDMNKTGTDLVSNFTDISNYIKDQREIFRATPLGWPTEGRLTSLFGRRSDPFQDTAGEFHNGLDIANALGTPVKATADGVVRVASWQGGYGRLCGHRPSARLQNFFWSQFTAARQAWRRGETRASDCLHGDVRP